MTADHKRFRKPPAVPSVETVPCPSTLGAENHELVNDARGRTTCVWCEVEWRVLDAGLRGAA